MILGPSAAIYPNPLPIDVMQHEKTEYNNKEIPQTISQLNTYEDFKKTIILLPTQKRQKKKKKDNNSVLNTGSLIPIKNGEKSQSDAYINSLTGSVKPSMNPG